MSADLVLARDGIDYEPLPTGAEMSDLQARVEALEAIVLAHEKTMAGGWIDADVGLPPEGVSVLAVSVEFGDRQHVARMWARNGAVVRWRRINYEPT